MRVFVFLILLIPAIFGSYELFYLENVKDPIKYIYTLTGSSAISILFLSTIISLIKKRVNLMKYRRLIGLFGFFYASLHMVNFLVLDMELDFVFAFEETLDKPFIYLGMIAFLSLIFMALTSPKKLFAKYNKYHKVIYLVLTLTTIHFIMAQKSLSISQWLYVAIILIIAFFKFKQIKSKKRAIKSS